MLARVFLTLRTVTQRLVVLLVSAALFIGFAQTSVQAAPEADPVPTISPEELAQKRAQRREFQSEASKASDQEVKADSLGEVFADKLNLEEIADENEIVKDIRKGISREPSRK
ncbi:MAG: hypothetical protein WBB01_07870 [Phormidesmis sp.]